MLRVGDRIDAENLPVLEGERCASVAGVSLHANVAVPARDRPRLERLCHYVARHPVATERLLRLEDGRLLYRLKHRWRDGTTHVVFEPHELVEKLAALVPWPRSHLARYHGILGPCASERDHVVPAAKEAGAGEALHGALDPAPTGSEEPCSRARAHPPRTRPVGSPGDTSTRQTPEPLGDPPTEVGARSGRPRRLAWAELLRRVFAVDVLECPRCGGRMRILPAIHAPGATQAILECLGLPARAPPPVPARPEDHDWPDLGRFASNDPNA